MESNVSILRNRKKDTINKVREFDAFPKIQEKYTERTNIGGTLSLLSRILIIYLIYTEVNYYMQARLIFKFKPDVDIDAKLKVNIDLTVAMPCRAIGADILDSTNQNIFSFGVLEEEDTWWELCPNQKVYFEYMQHLNSYLREEYHSIAEILYKGEQKVAYNFPTRTEKPNRPYDACRIHGKLTLNKVSGNFHITAGKSIHFPSGHIHLNSLFDDTKQNFSHRINRFSFGEATAGIVHPLEGDEKIFSDSTIMMQYFIEIVPTDVQTLLSRVNTFQYSVKENARPINHDAGSHGIPGLYFKYDVSALKVIVAQDRENIIQFFIRLSSIIAGIVVIAGLLNRLILFLTDNLIKIISPESYETKKQFITSSPISQPLFASNDSSNTQNKIIQNKILSNANNVTNIVPVNLTSENTI